MSDSSTARPKTSEDAPTTPDPIEIAMGAEAHDASPDSPARVLLVKQGKLVEHQLRHMVIESVSLRLHLAIQLFLAFVAALAALLVGATFWAATRDHSVIVEPFLVPPELVSRGLTGQVAAAHLLDRLEQMQEETDSARPPSSYASDWGKEIKVEVPHTGMSVEDFRRLIYGYFGNQVRISGDIVRDGGALTLTTRIADAPGASASGGLDQEDDLLRRGAEQVYARLQPYRYATYLRDQGRAVEALSWIKRLAVGPVPEERPWAYSLWSVTDLWTGNPEDALRKSSIAISLSPNLVSAHVNHITAQALLGHDGAAIAETKLVLRLLRSRAGRRSVTDAAAQGLKLRYRAETAEAQADFAEAARAYGALQTSGQYNNALLRGGRGQATALIRTHNLPAARAAIAALDLAGDVDGFALTLDRNWPNLELAEATGDWPQAIAILTRADQRLSAGIEAHRGYPMRAEETRRRFVRPRLALAFAMSGDLVQAGRVAADMPADCYLCVRAQAQIATLLGAPNAEQLHRAAIQLAPEQPFAELEWAQTRLAVGDAIGAANHARNAAKLAPQWAEPLKIWGDALRRQKLSQAAREKYVQALELAPKWSELKILAEVKN